jgi:hypothetical protein
VELIVELEGIDKKIKAIKQELRNLIAACDSPDGTHRDRPLQRGQAAG